MEQKRINYSSYRASDLRALGSLIIPFAIGGLGVWASLSNHTALYILGQLLISFFFLQTFIVLHECGHMNFFKSRSLNIAFGNLFGFLTMIPFYSWQHMHNLHHKWTGWRDKDPTTEKTVEPSDSPLMRNIANFCWYLFIPIFFLVYKTSNYWNIGKMKRFLSASRFKKARMYVLIYGIIYVVALAFFWRFFISYLLFAFFLSLVWKELVILTQHSHIEIPISEGNEVKPIQYKDQVQYTRSFYVNHLFAHLFLLNFNLHEVHHAYPGIPAYYLHRINLDLPEEPAYFTWFRKAKSMKAEDYIFRTSKHTGEKF